MRVLILSVSAGGGHTHAAEAIEKYVKINNPEGEVKIIDTIRYINPILDKVVIGSYIKSLKISPAIFGKLYNFAEYGDSLSNVSNRFNEIMIYKLIPLIENWNPDVIICTHPFPTEMASILKLKNKISIPTISLLTDYAAHTFWIHEGIDAYIVACEDMVEDICTRGIERKIIHPLGIPVKPDFLNRFDKASTLKDLGLNENKTTLLLMGGSLGMGKIEFIYNEIQNIDRDIQLIVITGKNKKLLEQLNDAKDSNLVETRIIGYTNEVNKYMQACDLLITKPGGLTITEALVSNLPMAIFSAIPGQEEKNAEFLLKNNLAINLGDGKHCSYLIDNLLSEKDKLNKMKENCYLHDKANSGNDIYKLIDSLIK